MSEAQDMVRAAQFDVARAATQGEFADAREALRTLVAGLTRAAKRADEPEPVLVAALAADLAELCCETAAELPRQSSRRMLLVFADTLRAVVVERLAGKRRTR